MVRLRPRRAACCRDAAGPIRRPPSSAGRRSSPARACADQACRRAAGWSRPLPRAAPRRVDLDTVAAGEILVLTHRRRRLFSPAWSRRRWWRSWAAHRTRRWSRAEYRDPRRGQRARSHHRAPHRRVRVDGDRSIVDRLDERSPGNPSSRLDAARAPRGRRLGHAPIPPLDRPRRPGRPGAGRGRRGRAGRGAQGRLPADPPVPRQPPASSKMSAREGKVTIERVKALLLQEAGRDTAGGRALALEATSAASCSTGSLQRRHR